ncbi:TetR/AcrR family transcriptional regulator [Aeromicrobium alkaliterrae]|uniref:TetR family transcriptional regulator n=1 Tax=Aeromicrobium alkaliterrae TaxID=302168 RepID=A0ABN2K0L7_9ACTN
MTIEGGPERRQTDGRVARRQRTRHTVLEAHAALMAAGHLTPTAAEIADAAHVSVRTLWTVFGDMEGLFRATTDYWFANDEQLRRQIDPGAPLAVRVAAFCAERVRRLESIAPAARAAGLLEHRSAALRESRRGHVRRVVEDVERVFATELVASGAQRAVLLDALVAATSFNAWSLLRDDLGRTVDDAGAAMSRAVGVLLADVRPAPARARRD